MAKVTKEENGAFFIYPMEYRDTNIDMEFALMANYTNTSKPKKLMANEDGSISIRLHDTDIALVKRWQ